MTDQGTQITLGGSEAAIVLGISTYGTPLRLFLEKRGMLERKNLDDVEYVKAGKYIEDAVARWYADETGQPTMIAGSVIPVDRDGRSPIEAVPLSDYGCGAEFLGHDKLGARFAHKDRPWMTTHPDRLLLDEARKVDPLGVGEMKNANAFRKAEWLEGAPLMFQCQLQHNIEVMGLTWGALAAIVGGSSFHWFPYERHDAFLKTLIAKEEDFIRRVMENDPPDPIGSEVDKKALSEMFQEDVDRAITLPPESVEWDEKLAEAKAKAKDAESEKLLYENLLKNAMGSASIGAMPDGNGSFTLKTTNKLGKPLPPECLDPGWLGYTEKPSSFRVLRRSKKTAAE